MRATWNGFRHGTLVGCGFLALAIAGFPGGVRTETILSLPEQQRLPAGQIYGGEIEPNNSIAQATPIPFIDGVIRANVSVAGDVDVYSFQGGPNQFLHAALMTDAAAGSTDATLRLYDANGVLVEQDLADGSFHALSANIAGRALTNQTYYLRVEHDSGGNTIQPYELHLRITGTPLAEGQPQPPGSVLVSGSRSDPVQVDTYTVEADAGDTLYISLDLDPERDGVQWNGRVGISNFSGGVVYADDNSAGSSNNPLSEALFMTVKSAGTYFIYVDSAGTENGPAATYVLSAGKRWAASDCGSFVERIENTAVGPAAGVVTSTINVTEDVRIGDLDVLLELTHTRLDDLDITLTSPAGNEVALLVDNGSTAAGSTLNLVLDDEAAIPPSSAMRILNGFHLKPTRNARLEWFDGAMSAGTWTLTIRDDSAGEGGTLQRWGVRICPEQAAAPLCGSGLAMEAVYSSTFDADDGGFTHSGTLDEWERGLPTLSPITSCASGSACWKTDLDGGYNEDSSFDLFSPVIDLSRWVAPLRVRWKQRYQMHASNNDHYAVDLVPTLLPSAATLRLFQHQGPDMNASVGSPAVGVRSTSGWSQLDVDAGLLAGNPVRLKFHVDSENAFFQGRAGVAVDDVEVLACRPSIDAAMRVSSNASAAVPGSTVVLTMTMTNNGPDRGELWWLVSGGSEVSCSLMCVSANECPADLFPGQESTYSVTCSLPPDYWAPGSQWTFRASAQVPSSQVDPDRSNNLVEFSLPITPISDFSIAIDDGVTTVVEGGTVVYQIDVLNHGPSASQGRVQTSEPPPGATCNWTCSGPGTAVCSDSGSGSISHMMEYPSGSSARYTLTCQVGVTGWLSTFDVATDVKSPDSQDPGGASEYGIDSNQILSALVFEDGFEN